MKEWCVLLLGITCSGCVVSVFPFPSFVKREPSGFELMVRLLYSLTIYDGDGAKIDMGWVRWLPGDMCAVLGAVFHRVKQQKQCSVTMVNLPDELKGLMIRNGYLKSPEGIEAVDGRETTIPYQHLDISERKLFLRNIEDMMEHRRMTSIPLSLRAKFGKGFSELFYNAATHSYSSQGVFSCGQFFPNLGELGFTVVDLGIGIHGSVRRYLNRHITEVEAIAWALERRNTTKELDPGGSGLSFLDNFVASCDGCLTIISGAGCWQKKSKVLEQGMLSYPFPGTIVSVSIKVSGLPADM